MVLNQSLRYPLYTGGVVGQNRLAVAVEGAECVAGPKAVEDPSMSLLQGDKDQQLLLIACSCVSCTGVNIVGRRQAASSDDAGQEQQRREAAWAGKYKAASVHGERLCWQPDNVVVLAAGF